MDTCLEKAVERRKQLHLLPCGSEISFCTNGMPNRSIVLRKSRLHRRRFLCWMEQNTIWAIGRIPVNFIVIERREKHDK